MRERMEMRIWISRSGSSIVLLYEFVKKRSIERNPSGFKYSVLNSCLVYTQELRRYCIVASSVTVPT
jgi:hypothetical protein